MNLTQIILDFILNPWFIISLIFWIIVVGIVYLLRNKKESVYLFFPLLVMFKTKKLNSFIRRISRKFPKAWRIFFNIGIFVSFGFMIFGFWFFFNNLIGLIINPQIENAITPLIPGVTIELPLFAYLVIPLLFIMTTHELAHGITAEIDNVDVKSTGVMGAGVFYLIGIGAFVEVDERELGSSKYTRNTRLRISTAGTYVNAITTGIAFLLLLGFPAMISPFYGPQVSQVNQVLPEKEGGFNYGNVSINDVIMGIKKQNSSQDFVNLDANKGFSLNDILSNNTEDVKVSVGDILLLNIYIPSEKVYRNKTIILGPRYNLGIIWEKHSNNEIKITRVFSKEEGGNNYNKGLNQGMVISEINGTKINYDDGYTLESVLTNFNLKEIRLTSKEGEEYLLDIEVIGVVIGIITNSYWLPRNPVSVLFTGRFPELLFRELLWLLIIGFSITLFNMMPVPIFDGDRTIKELIEWIIGTKYDQTKKAKDIFTFSKNEDIYNLSKYRVKKIDSIKIITKQGEQEDFLVLGKENYELIDDIGDSFQDSVKFEIPKDNSLSENSKVEISYEYEYDSKEKIKKPLLNSIRIFTTGLIIANFVLSFLTLGIVTFWF
ncbi:MAG: Peptidase family M50 [Promethearchaeota archaeon]|nr:MAG: Peptidase family M50 [Candidatus Lokiarchaeota archaeon]